MKEDEAIVKKTAYIVLGVNSEVKKDVLGIYIGGNESAKFSPEIRRIMYYTTNVIENLNRIYRKVTKTRSSFPTDMALMKLLYLSTINLTEKWKTGYAKDWHLIKGQLAIEYEERVKGF